VAGALALQRLGDHERHPEAPHGSTAPGAPGVGPFTLASAGPLGGLPLFDEGGMGGRLRMEGIGGSTEEDFEEDAIDTNDDDAYGQDVDMNKDAISDGGDGDNVRSGVWAVESSRSTG